MLIGDDERKTLERLLTRIELLWRLAEAPSLDELKEWERALDYVYVGLPRSRFWYGRWPWFSES